MLKFLGGTFLIIGAVIGGGILAIPIVSAQFGFLTTFIIIIISWIVMTKTGLYVLSLCLSCPDKYNSYYSIVGKFLGDKVKVVTVILYLWLLYFSLSSYISGCVSLIISHLTLQRGLVSYVNISVLFVIVLGALIVMSSKIIVRLNVVLVIAKLTLLLVAIYAAYAHYVPVSIELTSVMKQGGWSLILIIINAFGFQFIIPSLVSYYNKNQGVPFKLMIVVSTTVVFCLYSAWLYTIYTLIPAQGTHGLIAIYHSNNQLLAFNTALFFHLHSTGMVYLLSVFEGVALFGSFFCVSLGIFDFLLDVFKTNNRLIVGLSTFLPPLLLTLLSENMYVLAMSIAGYMAIALEIIIPIFARIQQRRRASV